MVAARIVQHERQGPALRHPKASDSRRVRAAAAKATSDRGVFRQASTSTTIRSPAQFSADAFIDIIARVVSKRQLLTSNHRVAPAGRFRPLRQMADGEKMCAHQQAQR